MPTPTNTNLGSLDFDAIRASFSSFLSNQSQFTDYNLSGSNLSILIDMLAFSNHQRAWLLNMATTESNLTTAQLRNSVVAKSKDLGYTPRSWSCSVATVDVFTTDLDETAFPGGFIPNYAEFLAGSGTTNNYLFYTQDVYELVSTTGGYIAKGVKIYQGTPGSISYIVNTQDPNQKFTIPDRQVDTNTIIVRVQNSITDSTGSDIPWQLASDVITLESTDKAYYLNEGSDGVFEIEFGDDVMSAAVQNGNVVAITYLITDGDAGNGFGSNDSISNPAFVYTSSPTPPTTVTVTTDVPSIGGAPRESIQSIQFNAPRLRPSQGRAVTANDYASIISTGYPGVQSVYAYGGETATPPQYGKVFIAIVPTQGTVLTTVEKNSIATDILKSKNVINVTPVIVDADYVYILVSTKVYYNPTKTILAAAALKALVSAVIVNFDSTNLSSFGSDFRYSIFSGVVSSSQPSIVSNLTTIRLQKRVALSYGTPQNYTFDYSNPIVAGSVTTTSFNYYDPTITGISNCTLKDDSNGNVNIVSVKNSTEYIVRSNIGTVDYINGIIKLVGFSPTSASANYDFRITATPQEDDIFISQDKVLRIDTSDVLNESIAVSVIDNSTVTGR